MKLTAACILLLGLSAGAQQPAKIHSPKQIQIGTFRFFGTNDPNCGFFCSSGYEVIIDASALTGDVLSFGDIVVCIGTVCQHSGPETTPIDGTFPADPGDILPDCAKVACRSIDLQLLSTTGQPFSLVLLDGARFTTYAINTITLKALPGQHVLKPGQSVPITLALDRKVAK